jgi:hypothetical protein
VRRLVGKHAGPAALAAVDSAVERPSCCFEVGYADAITKPLIPIASKESVMEPGVDKIHFDIHQNVRFFTGTR